MNWCDDINYYFKPILLNGIFSFTARSGEALCIQERQRVHLCRDTHVWYDALHSGWRIYMEDAHIDTPSLTSDKKNSLFAIFDGHGGTWNNI